MFSKLFEERDKKVSLLIKLGDCLGRSLRENITLFSIDSHNSLVTYLTESNKVISGQYDFDSDVTLNNIEVQDSEVFKDGEVFDNFVNEKIHSFVENLHFGEYSSSDDSFSDILGLWENRMKLDSLQSKLVEKAHRLENIEQIIESDNFIKLVEIRPQLVDFLMENFEKLSSVPEVKNAVNLSNAVATSFNFPRLTYDGLVENKSYILKDGVTPSIYEMICRQELIKKELIESKKSFDVTWANNGSIRKLSSMIFEDNEKIVESLAEALRDVPYLALASKKSLFTTFTNCLGQTDGIGVSERDIQEYASNIFEIKKEAKQMFIDSINEKYGVNIQNLQEPASFKSLINTQIVIFEALSRLAPNSSILKQVLSEMASSLKNKSGIEGIDVNEFIYEIFSEAGYQEILEENKTVGKYTKIDFKRVAKDLGDVQDLVSNLQSKVDQEYSSDENVDQKTLAAQEKKEDEAPPEEASTEEAPPEEVAPEEEGEEGPVPEVPKNVTQKGAVDNLSDLESMIADIADEIGDKGDKKDKEETE
jgi:hypothetical protein